MSDEKIQGSCVCGGVTYEATPPFMAFQLCHCSRCRKASGSAHASNLFVAVEQFTWTAGEEKVKRYELPDARYWSHCFCETCGSAVPWLTRTGKALVIPAGTLDEDPGKRPERTIYFGSRAPWYTPSTEIETFETFPKKG